MASLLLVAWLQMHFGIFAVMGNSFVVELLWRINSSSKIQHLTILSDLDSLKEDEALLQN